MWWKYQHRSKIITFVALITAIFVLALYVSQTAPPEFNHYRLVREYIELGDNAPRHNQPRTILFWNDFFSEKRWYLPNDTVGPSYFRNEFQCAEYRCVLTNQHDYMQSVEMFDAIIFHTAIPFPLTNSIPAVRSPEQLYIFTNMECPVETKHELNDENYFYNLTMTYRLDSDVLLPYNYIAETATNVVVAPSVNPHWRQPPGDNQPVWNDTAVWALWPGKTKMAAWFVSNCNTQAPRQRLAAKLQEYIDVDIYGLCGTLTCDRAQSDVCDRLLDEKYKFYFAFENSLCKDYVTEKAYNALKRQLIPVVFGGANYTRFLPPGSYINVEDFDTVEQLASYLKFVASDPTVYMRYFWYRAHYHLASQSQYCAICEKLHSSTMKYKTQSYSNIEKWWRSDSCRTKTHIKI